tara:strand:+ start:443 stop:2239 length:1797 start_codon:yes stop_codon:yes gene_type:complete
MTISNYSTTSSNNTLINSISIAEGMLPSDVNNAIRNELADLRTYANDKEWFRVGDRNANNQTPCTFTRASSTSVTVASTNVISDYHVGRRIKIVGQNTSTIYGVIATASFSTNSTISFTFDSGSIHAGDTTVDVFVGSPYVNPAIPVINNNSLGTSQILPPSQNSVKQYIDTTVTAQDLDFAGASGSGAVDLDSQTFTIAAGEGIDTVASGQTLTVSGELATTSNKGVASFSSDNFAVNSGVVTIKDGGVANAELVNDSVNFGGITVALGGSDTTPALNLTDAANYPTSSLTGTIANSQVATGIDAVKIANGSVNNTEFQYISTLSSNAQDQLTAKLVKASNLSDVSSASTSRSNLGLGTISTQASNSVSISGGAITGMGTPSNNTDVANKSYVDQAIAGLRNRTVAECASTGNVNISNGLEAGDSIDGVTLVAGDRVLLKSQSTATENGLYLAVASGAGAASRDPEHDTIAELSGGMIVVNQGSSNNDKIFLCTTDNSGSIGSTSIVYSQVTPSNTGTVESVGITQSGSEFTIGNTPITSTGNITLNVNRISATKIGSGTSVSDTEYGYLSNVSSDIQAQLNAKATAGFALAMAVAL